MFYDDYFKEELKSCYSNGIEWTVSYVIESAIERGVDVPEYLKSKKNWE